MKAEKRDQLLIIRQKLAWRITGLVLTVLMGALVVLFAVISVGVITTWSVALGAFIAAMAGVMGLLFLYMLRNTLGNLGWRIAIGADALDLDLPRGRSLIHRLESVHAHVRFEEIEAVEGRLEAYPSFGKVNMQLSYALKLKTGGLIILGEDRALNTKFTSSTKASWLIDPHLMTRTVLRIVRRGELGTRDLGMVEGSGGILGVLFASAPPWEAPSLGAERQAELWSAAGMTGVLAEASIYVTLLGNPAFANLARVQIGRQFIETRKHLEAKDGPSQDERPFGKDKT